MPEPVFPSTAAAMPVRFVLYLPAEPRAARGDAAALEAAVVRILCERFGGVTAYPARGTFTLASGVPETEPVTVLETYGERDAWREHRDGMARLARAIAWLLDQEALGCSVNGKMILIDAAEPEVAMDGELEGWLRQVMEKVPGDQSSVIGEKQGSAEGSGIGNQQSEINNRKSEIGDH
jgi:hypothetical protein